MTSETTEGLSETADPQNPPYQDTQLQNPPLSVLSDQRSPFTTLTKYQCPLHKACSLPQCPFGHQISSSTTSTTLQPVPFSLCFDHLLGGCPNRVVRQPRGLLRCHVGYHPSSEDLLAPLEQYLSRVPPVTPNIVPRRMALKFNDQLDMQSIRSNTSTESSSFDDDHRRRIFEQCEHDRDCHEETLFRHGLINGLCIAVIVVFGLIDLYLAYRTLFGG